MISVSYSAHPQLDTILHRDNGGEWSATMDGSSTIDPAALFNTSASGANGATSFDATANYLASPAARGTKRSRSPDFYDSQLAAGAEGDDVDDSKPRKRGRPPKHKGGDGPTTGMPLTPATPNSTFTPSAKTQLASQVSPTRSSPPRNTPTTTKPPAVKALPTVRDHTLEKLNDEGDEYLPREKDVDGEKKVDENGYLVDRQYRLRTFTVPHRGTRLFMLATECARVLNYRDSYLLFNKNRSLYKIIASQEEKDHLISVDVLPYSYRSRQIAIVTARSMFRQFGSRVIQNGRRVKDDYWEAKAIKQGFTEEDAAGEKRPGAGKQREAAAAEQRANTLAALPRGEVVFTAPMHGEAQPAVPHGIDPVTFVNLPGVTAFSPDSVPINSFLSIARPRQEITGQAYEDQTREGSTSDIASHASSAAEYNKVMTQQRSTRQNYLNDYWRQPHDAPPSPVQSTAGETPGVPAQHQNLSPPPNAMASVSTSHQMMMPHAQQSQMMGQHAYMQPGGMMAQSPSRAAHQQLPQGHVPQSSPSLGGPGAGGRQHTPTYNYGPGGMWPPPQPQPSPLQMQSYGQPAQQHHVGQQISSPMHPPSQLPRQGGNLGYPQMQGYGQVGRGMYQQGSPQQQHFAQGQPGQQHGHPQQQQAFLQGSQAWGQPSPGMSGADWQRGFQ